MKASEARKLTNQNEGQPLKDIFTAIQRRASSGRSYYEMYHDEKIFKKLKSLGYKIEKSNDFTTLDKITW